MKTTQDRQIEQLLRAAGFDSSLVEAQTARDTGEVTWATFKGRDEYFSVEAIWTIDSTHESVAAELTAKARGR